jgi:transposase-like protein
MNKNANRPYTLQDHLMVEAMYEAGKSYAEIAKQLGRSRSAIKSRIRTFGHKAANQPVYDGRGTAVEYKVPPPEVLADRNARLGVRYGNLTSALMGDPKPGYSALDKQEN